MLPSCCKCPVIYKYHFMHCHFKYTCKKPFLYNKIIIIALPYLLRATSEIDLHGFVSGISGSGTTESAIWTPDLCEWPQNTCSSGWNAGHKTLTHPHAGLVHESWNRCSQYIGPTASGDCCSCQWVLEGTDICSSWELLGVLVQGTACRNVTIELSSIVSQ